MCRGLRGLVSDLRIRVRRRRWRRGAVDAKHGGEFAAGGDAVAGAEIAGVDEGAKLITELNVQWDVGFWLEMHWEHCLSP